jgi:hypothetical protein
MAQRPEYLTVPEVMERLRLGRTTVYEQARLYLATGGAEGIPCRRFGRSLRFPAAAFDTVENRPAADDGAQVIELPRPRPVDRAPSAKRPRTRRHRATDTTVQSPLPFAD